MWSWLIPFALFQMEQGRQAYQVQDWPAAERSFVEALRRAPSNAAAHKWLRDNLITMTNDALLPELIHEKHFDGY